MPEINFNRDCTGIILDGVLDGPNNKRRIQMALDTGATYCIAPFETIEKIGYEPANSKEIIPINTASGLIHAPLVRIKSLNVLGEVVENIEILCHNIPNVSRIEGLLGLNYLKHFKLTIDFKKGILELE